MSACMVTEIGGGFIIIFWAKRGHAIHSLRGEGGSPGGPCAADATAAARSNERAKRARETDSAMKPVAGRLTARQAAMGVDGGKVMRVLLIHALAKRAAGMVARAGAAKRQRKLTGRKRKRGEGGEQGERGGGEEGKGEGGEGERGGKGTGRETGAMTMTDRPRNRRQENIPQFYDFFPTAISRHYW